MVQEFFSLNSLNDSFSDILDSPITNGTIELIVCRPKTNARKILTEAELTIEEGLVGDCWKNKRNFMRKDGLPDVEVQLTLMNSRCINAIAGSKEFWPLAGDQLFVDLNLCKTVLQPKQQLKINDAIIEITDVPHLGCSKFSKRFGSDALKFVNSKNGKLHNLRGVNAKIIQPGVIKTGAIIERI